MRVLFATDGQAPARSAGLLLEAIADGDRTEVVVFCVVPPPYGMDAGRFLEQVTAATASAHEIVDDAAQRLLRSGLKTETEVATGDPAREIERELDRGDFHLVVVGAGRAQWLGNLLLGSVSTHVLHHSPVSALIAHERDPTITGGIVLGVDGSDGARTATRVLADLIDARRCSVRVAAVVPPPSAILRPGPAMGFVLPPDDSYRLAERAALDDARRNAQEAVEFLRLAGIHADSVVPMGYPARELLVEMEKEEGDLLVVGARGLGAVQRALIGSVGDRVARLAPATLVARSYADDV